MRLGHTVYDPKRMDSAHVVALEIDRESPSSGRRAQALVTDMQYLAHSDALALLPQWEDWHEARSLYHAANALHKHVIFVGEEAFSGGA